MHALRFLSTLWLGMLLWCSTGLALADYIKVSNSGKPLPATAILGSGAEDWACTYDSSTQLIWEVKTTDGGLRDQEWIYTWSASESSDADTPACKNTGRCNTAHFIEDVNAQGLCGSKDWRLPVASELKTLVFCSAGKHSDGYCTDASKKPTIDSPYFPNTPDYMFYASPAVGQSNAKYGWLVDFDSGYDGESVEEDMNMIRLVRSGQPVDGVPVTPLPMPTQNSEPHAAFTATLSAATVPLSIAVDASPSTDADGSIVSYAWTSSTGETANGKTADFTFSTAGAASITLTVTDNEGATHKMTQSGTLSAVAIPISTPSSGSGYIEGNILNACNKKPLASVDVHFSGGSDRTQQTDRDGHYSIKLDRGDYTLGVSYTGYQADNRSLTLAENETRVGNFALTPAAGCVGSQAAKTRQALIIAGSGPKLPDADNHIWLSTQALADRAYTALRLQGFSRESIRYLSADPLLTARDADGDGNNDINGRADLDTLQQTLTEWGGGVEQMVVYLIGHGGVGSFQLNRDTLLTPTQLKPWLDTVQAKLITDQRGQPGKLSLIIDACKSGSFLAPLAASNRYIVTSTAADLDAVVANKDGSNSFSYHFWGQIGFKDGWLSTAFQQARQSMSSELVDRGRFQKAMLDADGSGGETSEDDYQAMGSYCYGNCTTHASVTPVIESVSPLQNLEGSLSSTFKVRASKPLAKAWVTLQRPDYHFPSNGTALTSMLQINLTCNGTTSCEGEYTNFNLNDYYHVTFNVEDFDQNLATPYSLTLYQNGLQYSNEKKSADAVYEASTGVLTLKDVLYAGQHYYVELQHPPGDYRFTLKPMQLLQTLSEAASNQPAQFDGQTITVPSVFVDGHYYALTLVSGDNGFTLGALNPL